MDCIFCKIINKEIPSFKIYEDEYTYAFLDISKDVDGHTLVIPKKHSCNVLDTDVLYLDKVIETVKLICKHYVDDCGYDGCNILNASGESAQQTVMHLHFHIIPRKKEDGVDCWPHMDNSKKTLEESHQFLKVK